MKLPVFLLVLSCLSGCQSWKSKQKMIGPDLYQHWIHSFEEDEGDKRVFRPAGYPFPPARGREGMEFREDGNCVQYAIGPNDVPQEHPGKWSRQNASTLTITLGNQKEKTYSIKIHRLEKDRLIIQKF